MIRPIHSCKPVLGLVAVRGLVAALVLAGALAGPGSAQSIPDENPPGVTQDGKGGEPAARPPAGIADPFAEKKQKAELLEVLFDQLARADSEEAAQLIEKSIWKLWIDSGSATIDLAMSRVGAAMENKDLPLALDLLNAIVKLKPDYAEGWNKRATVLYALRDFTHSMQDIERTLALEPRHFGALSGLGLIFMEIDNKAGALKAFRRALEIHPYLANARRQEENLRREVEGRGI